MKSHRSYLFVPGNRPERFAKASQAGADAVVIDLEDAVLPEAKAQARAHAVAWLSEAHPVYVRINATDTEWVEDDLVAINCPGLAGVMLPKTAGADDIRYISSRLRPGTPIIALIETARGLLFSYEIASMDNILRLAFGSIDFQLDAGIVGDQEELLYARSNLVISSRAAGIQAPIDGVTTSTSDRDRVMADTRMARKLGFGAKLCIHPSQIESVHEGFNPSPVEIEWARGVISAMEAGGDGAISFEGRMIDRPVFERAKAILALRA